jgi:colanic acid biosynthesis glycosyl transferase WcaI
MRRKSRGKDPRPPNPVSREREGILSSLLAPARSLRILILGINYAPEPVGIGPYTAEMAAALAGAGHVVEVVTAKPYYPDWRVAPGFEGRGMMRATENGVLVRRVPLYVPREPRGPRRILHHLSFAMAAFVPMLHAARRMKPDVVMTIAPSMIAAPVARWAARLAGARSWLHIQDFEVGAAFATGLIDRKSVTARLARWFERYAYGGFDRYSSISPQMCARLVALGVAPTRVQEFRNWADLDAVRPLDRPSAYRAEWAIAAPHVALYSGTIARKQGIGIIIDAARRLRHRSDILFLVCGEGPNKATFMEAAAGLPNIRFEPLQPRHRLGELVGLATVHLLPQLADAADLVLPSKLTNMLASGRPVVATAAAGTGLANEVNGCGAVVPPNDADAFADAIAALIDNPEALAEAGRNASRRAEERWSKTAILGGLESTIAQLAEAP